MTTLFLLIPVLCGAIILIGHRIKSIVGEALVVLGAALFAAAVAPAVVYFWQGDMVAAVLFGIAVAAGNITGYVCARRDQFPRVF